MLHSRFLRQIFYTADETADLDQWMHKDIPSTWSTKLEDLENSATYSIQVAARAKEVGFDFFFLPFIMKMAKEE